MIAFAINAQEYFGAVGHEREEGRSGGVVEG